MTDTGHNTEGKQLSSDFSGLDTKSDVTCSLNREMHRTESRPPSPSTLLPGEPEASPWGPGCWRTPPSNTQRRHVEGSKQEKPAGPSSTGRKLPNSFAASRPALGLYWERKQDSKEDRRRRRAALVDISLSLALCCQSDLLEVLTC